MAKQANKVTKATVIEPDEYSFTGDSGPPIDEPPIEDSRFERDYSDAADADVDDEPDADSAPHEGNGAAGDDKPLLSPAQLKNFKDNAERMRRPVSFMKCDDLGNYTIAEKDVTGATAIAVIDWLITQRSLWVGGKPVEFHGHLWTELNGKKPPHPNTFTDNTRWPEYNANGKKSDPWNNFQDILPLRTPSGGIISFQASTLATKAAIGELLAAFIASGGQRRPVVQFTSEVNEATGLTYPVLRIVGYEEGTPENFDFLREMLIKDDPEFPEPKKSNWSGFGE